MWNLNFWPTLSTTDQDRSLTNASQTGLLHRHNDSYVSSVNIFHFKFNTVDFIERTILDILYTGDASKMVVMMRATVNRGTAENRPKYQNAEYGKMIIIKKTFFRRKRTDETSFITIVAFLFFSFFLRAFWIGIMPKAVNRLIDIKWR